MNRAILPSKIAEILNVVLNEVTCRPIDVRNHEQMVSVISESKVIRRWVEDNRGALTKLAQAIEYGFVSEQEGEGPDRDDRCQNSEDTKRTLDDVLLPIGTIVEIEDKDIPVMIVGHRIINHETLKARDYVAVYYPKGLERNFRNRKIDHIEENLVYFDHNEITRIVKGAK